MLQENRYSWSGDDMRIRNSLGDVVFRVNGKTFSLHGRKGELAHLARRDRTRR